MVKKCVPMGGRARPLPDVELARVENLAFASGAHEIIKEIAALDPEIRKSADVSRERPTEEQSRAASAALADAMNDIDDDAGVGVDDDSIDVAGLGDDDGPSGV